MPSTETYTLSLHDALPISRSARQHPGRRPDPARVPAALRRNRDCAADVRRSEEHTSELQSHSDVVCRPPRPTPFPYTTLFRSLDPHVNIQVGAQILREYLQRYGETETALQMYADRKSTRLNSSHTVTSYAVHRDLHPFPTRRSSDLSSRTSTSRSAPRSCASSCSATAKPRLRCRCT